MKKTISKAELVEWGACEDGFNRFIEQTDDTDEVVAIESLFNGENTVSDLIWLACRTCTAEKIHRFARDIALINIELIKSYCSADGYKLILHFLNTGKDADSARVATIATYNTVRTSYAATSAAHAVHAATRATHAGHADHAATHAAATACVYAAVDADAADIDFTPYLRELFS